MLHGLAGSVNVRNDTDCLEVNEIWLVLWKLLFT